MYKKKLWKDIRQAITSSWGRFLSIFCLMVLGVFAFVGLKVTGPDMRSTAETFYSENHLADMSVISTYGLDDSDRKVIDSKNKRDRIEYGYLKDVVVKNTDRSFRIFSAPEKLSRYEVTKGAMPKRSGEIALDYLYDGEYKLGDHITFTEEEDTEGNRVLKKHRFKIVGFVKSSELVNKTSIGQTTVGTGELNGYAVVPKSTFDSDVYMIARLSFTDTKGLTAYSDEYNGLVQKHRDSLTDLLKYQPEKRLAALKAEKQVDIDDGWNQVNEAKQQIEETQSDLDDAQRLINDAKAEVAENEEKLTTEVATAQSKIEDGQRQINDATASIASAESQLASARKQLRSGQATLDEKWNQLQSAKVQLDQVKEVLNHTNGQLQNAAQAIQDGKTKIADAYTQIAHNGQTLATAQNEINENQENVDAKKAVLAEKQSEIDNQQKAFNAKQAELVEAQREITAKRKELSSSKTHLINGKASYEKGIADLENGMAAGKGQLADLQSQQTSLAAKMNQLEAEKKAAEQSGDAEKVQEIQTEMAAANAQLGQVNAGIANIEQNILSAEEKRAAAKAEYERFLVNTYTPGMAKIEAGQKELDDKQSQVDAGNQEAAAAQAKMDAAQSQIDAGSQQVGEAQARIDAAQQQVDTGYNQLNQAKATLAQQEATLASKEKQYEEGLAQYHQGIASYNMNLTKYYDGLNQWQAGIESLNDQSAKYQNNAGKLAKAKSELADKEGDLAEAKNKLAAQQSEGQQKINDAKVEIKEKEVEYNDKLNEFKREKEKAEKEIAENEQDLKQAQEDLAALELPKYTVNDRKDNPGYKNYLENSQRIDVLSNVFPVFLFAIAALVSLTTMTRFVDEQRIDMGTLKALGYSNMDIKTKFVVYGLVSSVLGAAVGALLGHTLLPKVIFNAYAATSTFADIDLQFAPFYTILAFLIAIVCTVLSAYLTATNELKAQPASLLLPKPPKTGSRILLERITPVWNRMNFTYKVTARNLFRYKKRMLMTIFGVAGCTALLITGIGIKDSLSGIVDRQFGDLIKYDLIIVKNEDLNADETKDIDAKLDDSSVEKHTNVYYEELTKVAGENKDTQDITMLVPEKESTFKDFVYLQNRESGETIELADDSVVISEKLAELLDVSVGDAIKLSDDHGKLIDMKVSGITEMYMGHYVFIGKKEYAEVFDKEMVPNASLVGLKNGSESAIKETAAQFMELDGVKGVMQNIQLSKGINAIMKGLNHVVLVLIVCATLLAIVVIYNLTNINVSERMRELSTIKVLGFYDKEVTLYIYRETIILSVLGILAGYIIGFFLHAFIVISLPPDDSMFNPDLWVRNFAVSGGITLLITFIIMIVMHYKIKSVNMLDALKSVE